MPNELQRILQQQDRISKLADPYAELRKLGVAQWVDPLESHRQLLKSMDPMADIRRSVERMSVDGFGLTAAASPTLLATEQRASFIASLLPTSSLTSELTAQVRTLDVAAPFAGTTISIQEVLQKASEASRRYTEQFRLPALPEIPHLARGLTSTLTSQWVGSSASGLIEQAMGKMHSPWLQLSNQPASAAAFADLMSIGVGLKRFQPYDEQFAQPLRGALGDWRQTAFAPESLVDPWQRRAFYVEHGFNTNLTDFPTPAFHDGLEIAGLGGVEPQSVPTPQGDVDLQLEDSESLAQKAFLHLHRFEVAMRDFLEARLREAYGDRWLQAIPADVLQGWQEKKQRGEADGKNDLPLIAYSDFTDYTKIIDRKNNWNHIFQPVFKRREDVKESLHRLGPVRIAVMHSRVILHEDELMLGLETRRVLGAIRLAPTQNRLP